MNNLTIYQAKAGDGVKMKGLKRVDSFFETPEEAASEAFSLKARLDKLYDHNIQWDYKANMSGSLKKVKILRGYLNGNRKTNPFYLEIISTKKLKTSKTSSPIKPKKMSEDDQKIVKNVSNLFNSKSNVQ